MEENIGYIVKFGAFRLKFETRIESLAWKALLSSFNMGLHSAYKSENYFKYVWVTPKAEINCKTCKTLDGIVLTSENIMDILPCHPSCCCIIVPKM